MEQMLKVLQAAHRRLKMMELETKAWKKVRQQINHMLLARMLFYFIPLGGLYYLYASRVKLWMFIGNRNGWSAFIFVVETLAIAWQIGIILFISILTHNG